MSEFKNDYFRFLNTLLLQALKSIKKDDIAIAYRLNSNVNTTSFHFLLSLLNLYRFQFSNVFSHLR